MCLRIGNFMKLAIPVLMAVSLGLSCVAHADQYSDLAAQGYRWVTVDGPYACTSEQNLRRMTTHHTDANELHMVENVRCYYLIPGTIAQVIKEDPALGMSEMHLASIIRPLWTYTTFLSKYPVRDTYGVMETPENAGLVPTTDAVIAPGLPSDNAN